MSDITALVSEITAAIERIKKTRENIENQEISVIFRGDQSSDAWRLCAGWLAERRPDVLLLLELGKIREAFGIAFIEGMKRGELTAFQDPARHDVLAEVDGRLVKKDGKLVDQNPPIPVPDLSASRSRHEAHRTADQIIRKELQRVMELPGGHLEIRHMLNRDGQPSRLSSKAQLIRQMRINGVPKGIAEGAVPEWWPKGRPGPGASSSS